MITNGELYAVAVRSIARLSDGVSRGRRASLDRTVEGDCPHMACDGYGKVDGIS